MPPSRTTFWLSWLASIAVLMLVGFMISEALVYRNPSNLLPPANILQGERFEIFCNELGAPIVGKPGAERVGEQIFRLNWIARLRVEAVLRGNLDGFSGVSSRVKGIHFDILTLFLFAAAALAPVLLVARSRGSS